MVIKSVVLAFAAVAVVALTLALIFFIEFSPLPAGWVPSH